MVDENTPNLALVNEVPTIQSKVASADKRKGKHTPGLPKKSSAAAKTKSHDKEQVSTAKAAEDFTEKSLDPNLSANKSARDSELNPDLTKKSSVAVKNKSFDNKSAQDTALKKQGPVMQEKSDTSSDADSDSDSLETSLSDEPEKSSAPANSDSRNAKSSPPTPYKKNSHNNFQETTRKSQPITAVNSERRRNLGARQ